MTLHRRQRGGHILVVIANKTLLVEVAGNMFVYPSLLKKDKTD